MLKSQLGLRGLTVTGVQLDDVVLVNREVSSADIEEEFRISRFGFRIWIRHRCKRMECFEYLSMNGKSSNRDRRRPRRFFAPRKSLKETREVTHRRLKSVFFVVGITQA